MSLIRDFFKYLNRRRFLPLPPGQYITPYSREDATKEDVMLMMAGVARSPQKAQDLLKQKAKRAVDVLAGLPKRRPINRVERLERLIAKWQNARAGKIRPYEKETTIRLNHRYREPKS